MKINIINLKYLLGINALLLCFNAPAQNLLGNIFKKLEDNLVKIEQTIKKGPEQVLTKSEIKPVKDTTLSEREGLYALDCNKMYSDTPNVAFRWTRTPQKNLFNENEINFTQRIVFNSGNSNVPLDWFKFRFRENNESLVKLQQSKTSPFLIRVNNQDNSTNILLPYQDVKQRLLHISLINDVVKIERIFTKCTDFNYKTRVEDRTPVVQMKIPVSNPNFKFGLTDESINNSRKFAIKNYRLLDNLPDDCPRTSPFESVEGMRVVVCQISSSIFEIPFDITLTLADGRIIKVVYSIKHIAENVRSELDPFNKLFSRIGVNNNQLVNFMNDIAKNISKDLGEPTMEKEFISFKELIISNATKDLDGVCDGFQQRTPLEKPICLTRVRQSLAALTNELTKRCGDCSANSYKLKWITGPDVLLEAVIPEVMTAPGGMTVVKITYTTPELNDWMNDFFKKLVAQEQVDENSPEIIALINEVIQRRENRIKKDW